MWTKKQQPQKCLFQFWKRTSITPHDLHLWQVHPTAASLFSSYLLAIRCSRLLAQCWHSFNCHLLCAAARWLHCWGLAAQRNNSNPRTLVFSLTTRHEKIQWADPCRQSCLLAKIPKINIPSIFLTKKAKNGATLYCTVVLFSSSSRQNLILSTKQPHDNTTFPLKLLKRHP